MDAHQAYCLNFLALTRRWIGPPFAAVIAWAGSVVALTYMVVAAWMLGSTLAQGPGAIDRPELSAVGFWVALVVTPVNYLRFFGFFIGNSDSSQMDLHAMNLQTNRALFAVVSLVGPMAVLVVAIVLGGT